ncbi:PedC/BrcD family bacteriocin maturation disulfide isomerase [Enterococcus mundtii]|uniref:PedC/BrcD family bacteriocin maturation disulfide isomerase n=1 Tax=Enterococcus mundtii TaxID=53346 RepID=UPI00403D0AC9
MKKFVKAILSALIGVSIFSAYLPQTVFAAESNVNINEEQQTITKVTTDEYLSNIQGINKSTGKELLELIRSDQTYFMFIGYKSCPYCREFSKVVSTFKTQNSLPIYYVDLETNYSTDLTADEFKEFKIFFNEKFGTLYSPTFARIEHKNPIGGFIGGGITLEQLQSINN